MRPLTEYFCSETLMNFLMRFACTRSYLQSKSIIIANRTAYIQFKMVGKKSSCKNFFSGRIMDALIGNFTIVYGCAFFEPL